MKKKRKVQRWKKPKKVVIGALTFKIRYETPNKRPKTLLEEGESGCILQNERIICIDKKLEPPFALTILVHEILHGIGDILLPNKSPFCNEKFTNAVTHMLVQALYSSGILVEPS